MPLSNNRHTQNRRPRDAVNRDARTTTHVVLIDYSGCSLQWHTRGASFLDLPLNVHEKLQRWCFSCERNCKFEDQWSLTPSIRLSLRTNWAKRLPHLNKKATALLLRWMNCSHGLGRNKTKSAQTPPCSLPCGHERRASLASLVRWLRPP